MKKILISFFLVLFALITIQCSNESSGKINVQKDFDYVYDTMQKVYDVVLKHIKNPDPGLNIAEKYVNDRQQELEAIGKRLNSIILTQKESIIIGKFTERYTNLHNKHVDVLEKNLNAEQRRRFVTIVAQNIALKVLSQLKMPGSSTEFFKKLFR